MLTKTAGSAAPGWTKKPPQAFAPGVRIVKVSVLAEKSIRAGIACEKKVDLFLDQVYVFFIAELGSRRAAHIGVLLDPLLGESSLRK